MSVGVACLFRYMSGYRIECIKACNKTLVCCASSRLIIWNIDAKELVYEAKKDIKVINILFWKNEPFLVSSRALYDKKLDVIADLEFMSAFFVVDGKLVAIGKKYFTVVFGEAASRQEHMLDCGICTGSILAGQFVYASFENGKILRISNILESPTATELIYIKEPVTSIHFFHKNIAACALDSKLLLVDPTTGSFVFTRVGCETQKVTSIGPYILLLDCKGRLAAFDKALSFVGIIEESVVDIDVAENFFFVATTRRQIIQFELPGSPPEGHLEYTEAAARLERRHRSTYCNNCP